MEDLVEHNRSSFDFYRSLIRPIILMLGAVLIALFLGWLFWFAFQTKISIE